MADSYAYNRCPFTWPIAARAAAACGDGWTGYWSMTIGYSGGLIPHISVRFLKRAQRRAAGGLFRFDNFLASQPGFLQSVRHVWCHSIYGTKMYEVTRKLKALKPLFRAQRKNKGDLANNVNLAKRFLDQAQSLFDTFKEDALLELVQWCRKVYCRAVVMEDSVLRQRAKLRWLKYGDRCSTVFFRQINRTRVKLRVFQITNAAGDTITEADQVAAEFISYYEALLGGARSQRSLFLDFLQPYLKHTLTLEEATALTLPISPSEIKEAFFDISEDSAPGPDGFTSAFFKAAWDEIGADVCAAISEFFVSGRILKQINATLLVLIPKVQLPTRVSDFRPIACCNFISWVEQCVTTAAFSIALNGCLYGFFAGSRGLRQGDPISPYLFVLVMEILHVLLRLRIQPEGAFHYHWKCSVLGIINLCFADDVLIFCAGDISSVRLITERDRQNILNLVGFQEGNLPIKYLGVPLTASRLTVADCRPILEKVSARLAGWAHLNLSLAGRAQLLKSVLASLHMYWSSVFLLPKSIIKIIEQRMRSFLWQGVSGSGLAKVAWDQVCKTKEEGGLGIRRVLHVNLALIMKHVWRILQEDSNSIWVAWVLRYRLRNHPIWTVNTTSASWSWKKLVKASYLLKEGLEYRVGDGARFSKVNGAGRQRLILTFSKLCLTSRLCTLNNLMKSFGNRNLELYDGSTVCALWGQQLETHIHLFFRCSFTTCCLEVLNRHVRFGWPNRGWQHDITWAARRWRSRHLLNEASRALLASIVYNIWRERNSRIFSDIASSSEAVAVRALEEVRYRIISEDLKPSLQRLVLFRIWQIPWS
ncbi:UNVERIFIED_CONTAM: hypothetical protein Sradi_7049400 [Sesamum radiatum]|uniref:Reverse transcriptase domain-containing protein n=1 Tax=Sesamum radiatum TaxID=300843 RepID=A0AAW2J7X8_SESRA